MAGSLDVRGRHLGKQVSRSSLRPRAYLPEEHARLGGRKVFAASCPTASHRGDAEGRLHLLAHVRPSLFDRRQLGAKRGHLLGRSLARLGLGRSLGELRPLFARLALGAFVGTALARGASNVAEGRAIVPSRRRQIISSKTNDEMSPSNKSAERARGRSPFNRPVFSVPIQPSSVPTSRESPKMNEVFLGPLLFPVSYHQVDPPLDRKLTRPESELPVCSMVPSSTIVLRGPALASLSF